jgi:hypothetical protein
VLNSRFGQKFIKKTLDLNSVKNFGRTNKAREEEISNNIINSMKKIFILINLFLISNHLFSQNDTIKIELKNSSLSLKKCKGILFQQYFGNSFAYPPTEKITKLDSSFIFNTDTIRFQILKNKKVIVTGKKLPETEAFDTIIFYRNEKISRKEIWVQQYFLNNIGEISSSSKNALFASSDKVTWIKKIYFKNEQIKYELVKTIEAKKNSKVCFKTLKKRKKRTRRIKCKCFDETRVETPTYNRC